MLYFQLYIENIKLYIQTIYSKYQFQHGHKNLNYLVKFNVRYSRITWVYHQKQNNLVKNVWSNISQLYYCYHWLPLITISLEYICLNKNRLGNYENFYPQLLGF